MKERITEKSVQLTLLKKTWRVISERGFLTDKVPLAGRYIKSQSDFMNERRERWKTKEILRYLYFKWYRLIEKWVRPGVVLELGGGSGNLKEYFPNAISSDILFTPWLDAALDAQHIPFKKNSIDSIVLFDVLHHLVSPSLFFSEAERTLRSKGRIIMMEPYVSWASFILYRFFHQEGLDWHVDPMNMPFRKNRKEAFKGNQAIPSLIFEKYRGEFIRKFPRFNIIKEEKMDFILYPLSGGFHHPSLCPKSLIGFFSAIEKLLQPMRRLLAFRLFMVIEKS